MSRTYRSNPCAKFEYESGQTITVTRGDLGEWSWTRPHFQRLSKGGWKEAKRLLPKEEYAELRKLRSDKFTKYLTHGGVPHWYRNEIEKQHRQHTKQELHHYVRSDEYEPMVCKEPSGDAFYYWY